ncbi:MULTISPECIES: DUF4230 domain-containing protein [unclassified Synechocystis]|uniref:DUF4230 domain-containing protein n=1 Tax=unclassified Synechocystis TaxID=2640012 RepID=UPI00048E529B|nr:MULTISPECIES: DUF4230 domain-containing protein [unclassified Synechocystis]MCT0252335.1 DUF4230 domain-containing protein [Synechocystis sp. CS-94]
MVRSSLKLPQKIFKSAPLLGTGGLLFAMAIAIGGISQGLQSIAPWFRINNSEAHMELATLVVQQIRAVSELTTTVFAMETVVPTSQERQWGTLTLGRTNLLYIGYGEVRAGIDLAQLNEQDIERRGEELIVTLPAPKILDQKVDVARSRIYQYDRGFLNLGPDTAPELQSLAQRETLSKITAAACEQGILDQANEQAEIAVTSLLRSTGHQQVVVRTTTPSTCGLASGD